MSEKDMSPFFYENNSLIRAAIWRRDVESPF